MNARTFALGLAALCGIIAAGAGAAPIDRHALVTRHSPTITSIDRAAPFMIGNGNFAFTADITGLQTFTAEYSPLVPFATEAQWAWHSFPNPEGFTLESAEIDVGVPGVRGKFPWLRSWDEAQRPAVKWLRENPHKFSLGRLSLWMVDRAGRAATFGDLTSTRQTLDLWNGRLSSTFTFDGATVTVETSVHPARDAVIVRIESPLVAAGRLGVDLKFPGVDPRLNPDPADWQRPGTHFTRETARSPTQLVLSRELDATRYTARVSADRELGYAMPALHHYRLTAAAAGGGDGAGPAALTLLVEFSPSDTAAPLPDAETARASVATWWSNYWQRGAMVEFRGSRDPRADELERRVVLSQYLTAVNAAGLYPPQEEGLFSNSWNGKFHLEMHAWHAAHFAAWGRPDLLERSMPWYVAQLPKARERARSHGARGAWWPKMVGPEGRESPSTVNPFIMWQQPHPIYLAEAVYQARGAAALEAYRDVVFATADLLASWPHYDRHARRYALGPPVMPAQETYPPLNTLNPTFELAYWRFGLETAQRWRARLGLPRERRWDDVLAKLAPLPRADGLYLGAASQPDLWTRARDAACSRHAAGDCPNRDHPSFLAAYGYLPGEGVDAPTMRRTLDVVLERWDLRQTWGWDWPMLAMTAWRLGERDRAFDLLLTDAPNFQFGTSGMTPRLQLADDELGDRRVAETYFPSNGALLLAIALMAQDPRATGDGRWVMHAEGFRPLPDPARAPEATRRAITPDPATPGAAR